MEKWQRVEEAKQKRRERREKGREAIRKVLGQYDLPTEIVEALEGLLPRCGDGSNAALMRAYDNYIGEQIKLFLQSNRGKKFSAHEIAEGMGNICDTSKVIGIIRANAYAMNKLYNIYWENGDYFKQYKMPDGQSAKKKIKNVTLYWMV